MTDSFNIDLGTKTINNYITQDGSDTDDFEKMMETQREMSKLNAYSRGKKKKKNVSPGV